MFCDSCLEAVYDLDPSLDVDDQQSILAVFAADIPEHNCEAIEEPDLEQCQCPGHQCA